MPTQANNRTTASANKYAANMQYAKIKCLAKSNIAHNRIQQKEEKRNETQRNQSVEDRMHANNKRNKQTINCHLLILKHLIKAITTENAK